MEDADDEEAQAHSSSAAGVDSNIGNDNVNNDNTDNNDNKEEAANVDGSDPPLRSVKVEKPGKSLLDSVEEQLEFVRKTYDDVYYVRLSSSRVLYFGLKEDYELCKEIQAFLRENPETPFVSALEKYAKRIHKKPPEDSKEGDAGSHGKSTKSKDPKPKDSFNHADAILKFIYQKRQIDYILKYTFSDKFCDVRAAYERKLLQRGILLEHDNTLDPREAFVKIVLPFDILCEDAEKCNMKFSLKGHENVSENNMTFTKRILSIFGYGNVEPEPSAYFRMDRMGELEGGDFNDRCPGDCPLPLLMMAFFTKKNRCYLAHTAVVYTKLTAKQLIELDNKNLQSKKSSMTLSYMVQKGIYTKSYLLHDGPVKHVEKINNRVRLKKEWSSWRKIFAAQPYDMISDYFGEKIALYFAFLGFYTSWLAIAAFVGVIVFIYGIVDVVLANDFQFDVATSTRVFDNALTTPYAVFVSLWASAMVEMWRRNETYLAWYWDTLDFEEHEIHRPQWYSLTIKTNKYTGEPEHSYPNSRLYTKMFCSSLVIAFGVALVLLSLTAAITFKAWAQNSWGDCVLSSDHISICTGKAEQDPVNPIDCNDPCYSQLDEVSCTNSTGYQYEDGVYPFCQWDSSNGCLPACSLYKSKISCMYAPISNSSSAGDRDQCNWQDTYFASDVAGAFVNLVAILVLNYLFIYIGAILNDWENHKTETDYQNALITKAFFFEFLNSYASLFYIAYFRGTLTGDMFGRSDLRDSCSYNSCFTELMIQLVIIFLGKQLANQFMEVYLPYSLKKFRQLLGIRRLREVEKDYATLLVSRRESKLYEEFVDPDVTEESSSPPQWLLDEPLESYEGGLFDDYNEMVLQYGFVTMFVATFPLGPFFAFLNNISEIRTDSYKLVVEYQRPVPYRAESIGTWWNVLSLMGIFAVITNAFICAFSSVYMKERLAKTAHSLIGYDDEYALLATRLVFIVVFEHAVFFGKGLIFYFIPRMPKKVKDAIDQENYMTRLKLEQIDGFHDFDSADGDTNEILENIRLLGERFGEKVEKLGTENVVMKTIRNAS